MFYELLVDLSKGIREGLSKKGFRSPGAKKEEWQAPKVVIGIETPERPRPQSDFPYVAVVPVEGKLSEDGVAAVRVSFVCGVYTPEREPESGVAEVLRLAEAVVEGVRKRRYFGSFALEGPFEIFHDLERKHPFYLVEVSTVFVRRMEPYAEINEEVEHYGAGEY